MKVLQNKGIWIIIIILLLGLLFTGVELYISSHMLTLSNYSIASGKIKQPVRIVQLSDLHNAVFGEENEKLIAMTLDQKPDLVLVTGDILNSDEDRTDIAVHVIEKLSAEVPVYFSYGNHEKEYEENYGADLRQLFTDAGATVLEFDWTELDVNGQRIRLGGLYGYCLPSKYLETEEADAEECAFLEDFQKTDEFTILMCHMPLCWIVNGSLDDWDVDCVIAGHVHGGQIRIPFIGGLWAPDQGWFPGREAGLYYSDDGEKTLVVSRGLGSTEKIPRLNNIPEILTLDLKPE